MGGFRSGRGYRAVLRRVRHDCAPRPPRRRRIETLEAPLPTPDSPIDSFHARRANPASDQGARRASRGACPLHQGCRYPRWARLIVQCGRVGVGQIDDSATKRAAQVPKHLTGVATVALGARAVPVIPGVVAPGQDLDALIDCRSGQVEPAAERLEGLSRRVAIAYPMVERVSRRHDDGVFGQARQCLEAGQPFRMPACQVRIALDSLRAGMPRRAVPPPSSAGN